MSPHPVIEKPATGTTGDLNVSIEPAYAVPYPSAQMDLNVQTICQQEGRAQHNVSRRSARLDDSLSASRERFRSTDLHHFVSRLISSNGS
jgi:hypothetical protein